MKIRTIKQSLKKYRNIEMDFHSPQRGIVETILARGDYRVGELLYQVFKKGEIFSAWDSFFNYQVWEEAIEELKLEKFLSKIDIDETLPWDFVELNYEKKYLKMENKKSLLEKPTPSCLKRDCEHCKGCIFMMNSKQNPSQLKKKPVIGNTHKNSDLKFNRVRLFFQKKGNFRFFSHLSMIKYIERLIRKSGIMYKCTEGFHPRIKASYLPPIPVFAQGNNEVMEVFLDNKIDQKTILRLLRQVSGDFVFNQAIISNDSNSLIKDIHYLVYEINLLESKKKKQNILSVLVDTDIVSTIAGGLHLQIDYTNQGQQRFSKIYRILDPERKYVSNLTRKGVIFKSDSSH